MAVAVDATGTLQNSTTNVSTLSYTGITVGSGSNRGLVLLLGLTGAATLPTGVTATWDNGGTNQAMTSRATVGVGANNSVVYAFGLRAPTSGNKTLLISWTNPCNVSACAISFTGVDQTSDTTAFPNPNTAASSSTTVSLTITSATGNIPVSVASDVNTSAISAPNQTQIFLDTATFGDVGGQRAAGAASVTFTWTNSPTGAWGTAGFDVAAVAASTTVGWGFDPGLPTILKRRPLRKVAAWNSISRVEEENPPPIWPNAGWEVQSVQPPNPATTNHSRSNRLAASAFARGDEGTEFQQVQWFNAGGEVQPFQPANPATTNLSRSNRLASSSFARGDDGIEFPLVRWQNAGGEVQPFQPPNPATTNISRNNRRWAALVNGDDASGDESSTTNWINVGFENQPPQPPHPRSEKSGSIVKGDDGFYLPGTPQIQVVNWGFDPQPIQPPRFRLQRWAAIVDGDDASGDETATVNWSNIGFEQQNVQPPKLRLQRWAAFVNGDDASGEDSPLVNWTNYGWEVQSVQPPRFRLQRWAAFVNGDDATAEENALVNWFNTGWEVQPPQPPHPRREKSGAVAPLSNVESVFVPPVVTTPNLFDSVLPTLKMKWGNRSEAAGGDIQFISFDMQPWQEPQSVQPQHPRREKAGSIMPIESGIEAAFAFVPPPFIGWSADPVLPLLKGRSRTFSGAFANGDDATSEENPLVNWLNFGWEIQSVQPPAYPKVRQRYVATKGKTNFGFFSAFYPWGFEVQPPQPPHPRPERSGALAKGDEGIENTYVFVGATIVRWGFDGVYPQPPHRRLERSGAIQRGDDGTENPYIFVAPGVVNWGFDAQPIQPPRLKWERRGGGLKNKVGFAVTAQWLNAGWSVQAVQPPHPRPERSGALARNGDEGIENRFIPPPPQIINWGFDAQSVQPPRSPKIRQRYAAIKGRSAFAVFPTFVTWQFDGVCPQPPHPRRERAQGICGDSQFAFSSLLPWFPGMSAYEPMLQHPRPEKAGAIMPIEPGIEAAFIFVPLPPLPPPALSGPEVFKRPQRKAGAITPWSASYFMFVTSQRVFFAKSTITAATGPTVVSRSKTQTIVKGEPA